MAARNNAESTATKANTGSSTKRRLRSFVKEWVQPFIIVFLVLGTFRSAVADWMRVPTGSMLPTIVQGDRIFVNKLAYDLRVPFTQISLDHRGDPEPGDIAVLWSPEKHIRLVKRVIGVPGDTIEMRDNRLFRNGVPLEYEPAEGASFEHAVAGNDLPHVRFSVETIGEKRHPVMITPRRNRLPDFGPIVVPEGKYFAMGDNRDNSHDSRAFGFVDREAFIGRVHGVAFSLDPQRYWLPRWSRTGAQLQ